MCTSEVRGCLSDSLIRIPLVGVHKLVNDVRKIDAGTHLWTEPGGSAAFHDPEL